MDKNVFEYIKTEENNYKTVRIPLTGSKDWNMHEHIERCTNVANGWFHSGKNDGTRPYNDIVTPVVHVAFRSRGFDVKDIVPFVDDINQNYKSFIIKKKHPKWAREVGLDTIIDDVVESSVIYDLVIVKKVDDIVPEVVDLKTIAFCDQTEALAGPICFKHYYDVAELLEKKGTWNDDAIMTAIYQAEQSKKAPLSNDQEVKTPGKYVEVYELRGNLPESWIVDGGDNYKYVPQMHIVAFYQSKDGNREGITLYKGKDKPLRQNFKSLKIDRVRSKGRACGRSVVEMLFDPQVWANYAEIKVKGLLDTAFNVIITDSTELESQNLKELKSNTILKQAKGDSTQRLTSDISNITAFQNYQVNKQNDARVLGSASDAQLGTNPVSGTPFALQNLVVQQGQGIHEYAQGKIATFFADELYKDWILEWLIKDLNTGKSFSEEFSLDEINEIVDQVAENRAQRAVAQDSLKNRTIYYKEDLESIKNSYKEQFVKGSRKFFELMQDEFKDIPTDVMVNIKGKQRYMAQNADKITNLIREVIRNPQAFAQQPGISKLLNELLEESGFSPIDFAQVVKAQPTQQPQQLQAPVATG